MNTTLLSVAISITIALSSSVALACDSDVAVVHELDDPETSRDVTPPGKRSLLEMIVVRGVVPESSADCGPWGELLFDAHAKADPFRGDPDPPSDAGCRLIGDRPSGTLALTALAVLGLFVRSRRRASRCPGHGGQ